MYRRIFESLKKSLFKINKQVGGRVCGISLFTAYFAIFFAFFVWPHIVVYYTVKYQLDPSQTESLLQYMILISAGPIGVYLLAAIPRKRGRKNDIEGDTLL